MRLPFSIVKGQQNTLEPLKTVDEKTILETQVIANDTNIVWDNLIDLIDTKTDINIKDLEVPYQIAIVYLIRKFSVGSDLNVAYKCNCGRVTESILDIDDIIEFNDTDIKLKPNVGIKEILETPLMDQWALTTLSEPSSIKERLDIATEVRKCLPYIKFNKTTICMFCGYKKKHNLNSKDFCIRSLSDHSITTLYQQINNMLLNHISLADINSMFIFERDIHASLIQKRVEEHKEYAKNLISQGI